MSSKPTYQELENELSELKKQHELLYMSASTEDEVKVAYYANILNNIGDPVFVKDSESRLMLVNDAFCEIFNLARIDIIGKTLAEDVSEEERDSFLKIDKQVLCDGVENINEETMTVRGGETRLIATRKSRFIDAQGNKFLIGIIRDITERIKAEKDLKENEARFKALIKNSFDMIVLMDINGIQQFVSNSCEKILGFKQDELIGIPVIEKMIHPDDQAITLEKLYEIIKYNGSGGAQYRHLHKNGSWVYLEAFGSNQLSNPAIKSVVLNVRDITDRKIAEQLIKENEIKLKELNATKDKLFSIIAHDLRSPFNSILGFSELLKGKLNESDISHYEQYGTMINSSAKSTLVLLDNLLNWAKSQTGQISFDPQKISLTPCIQEIIELTTSQAKIKNITVNFVHSLEYEVVADENFLRLILQNLISNAIKFTHLGGEIQIGVTSNENQVEITISDTGIGMKEEKVASLFKIASNKTTRGTANEKGSGLGLVLCKEFVEKQGGTIWVESIEGKGTDFKFTLPLFKS